MLGREVEACQQLILALASLDLVVSQSSRGGASTCLSAASWPPTTAAALHSALQTPKSFCPRPMPCLARNVAHKTL